MKALLEIACFSLEALQIAQSAGASRIEFCQNYHLAGLSPDEEDILQARQILSIPLHVMIRPRAGHFVYSKREKELMQHSIRFCKNAGVDGLVFGLLTENAEVDQESCSRLIELAEPLPCFFHRALDETADPERAIEQLVQLGFKGLLSSGAAANALQGAPNLARWREKWGDKLQIMAGGAVRASNLREIQHLSGCNAFHSSAITNEALLLPDAEEVRRMQQVLNNK